MCNHNNQSFFGYLLQKLHNLHAVFAIKCTCWLICKNDFWIVNLDNILSLFNNYVWIWAVWCNLQCNQVVGKKKKSSLIQTKLLCQKIKLLKHTWRNLIILVDNKCNFIVIFWISSCHNIKAQIAEYQRAEQDKNNEKSVIDGKDIEKVLLDIWCKTYQNNGYNVNNFFYHINHHSWCIQIIYLFSWQFACIIPVKLT